MEMILTVLAITVAAFVLAMRLICVNDRNKEQAAWDTLVEMSAHPRGVFDPAMIQDLPEPAQRYFLYTISPGTPLRTRIEIEMKGELGLGSKHAPNYRPMVADEILAPPHGLIWRLSAGTISGSDGATSGRSWTRFWLFGIVPLVRAGGTSDHLRSAFGRVVSEGAFWVPASLLPGPNVIWEAIDETAARAVVTSGELQQAIDISVAEDGSPVRVIIQRWSNANPDKIFRYQPFGGYLSRFREFCGYRLPTRVEGGNLIGTDDYFPFFKAEVTGFRTPVP